MLFLIKLFAAPPHGFVGCFNSYRGISFIEAPYTKSNLMHKTGCIESCRALDALYAIYTFQGTYNHRCECANENHVSTFHGIKDKTDTCDRANHWVSFHWIKKPNIQLNDKASSKNETSCLSSIYFL